MTDLIETTEQQDTERGKFLTFQLEKELYGIAIQYVNEIVGVQKINDLPEAPDYVKGIINLRGTIIPVIDMRLRFKKPEIPYTNRTCIVVISVQDIMVGLIVDRVDEVLSITDENIVPAPDYKTGFRNQYIKGIAKVGNDIRLLLDCEKIFADREWDALNQINS